MMGVLFVIMNFLLSYFWASTPISGCWSWACWFVIQTAISPAAALQLCWFHIGDNNKQLGINFLWDDIQHHRWLWENSCGKNCTISLFLDSSAVVFRIRWWSWQLLVLLLTRTTKLEPLMSHSLQFNSFSMIILWLPNTDARFQMLCL